MAYNNSQLVQVTSSDYWFIYGNNDPRNFRIWFVVEDDFADEYEEEEILLLERGRRFEYGTRWGYRGTLRVQVRNDVGLTARQQRLRIQQMRESHAAVYLRTPFGDVFRVATGNIQVGRMAGVGVNEYCDITIPYAEVMDD